jgi:hypothetical protein
MIKPYSQILNEMLDVLDSYIAPKRITRENTNFVYLIMKAIAKGYETILSALYTVSGKFDPARCSDADLYSIAKIVGTKIREGKPSGLIIVVTNTDAEQVTLPQGEYVYSFSDDAKFHFTVQYNTTLDSLASKAYSAFTENKGPFPVDSISTIPVNRVDGAQIPSSLKFACLENSRTLGYYDESLADFRRRILVEGNRQDSLVELEETLRNLPYIFDCKLYFNQTESPVTVGSVTVDPYKLLIVLSGDPRDEIAEIVASSTFYQTVMVDQQTAVYYSSPVLYGGKYTVYYTNFATNNYTVSISFKYDSSLVNIVDVKAAIASALTSFMYNVYHTQYVRESDIYEALKTVQLPSVVLLSVTLKSNGVAVPYVESSVLQVPVLQSIEYVEV